MRGITTFSNMLSTASVFTRRAFTASFSTTRSLLVPAAAQKKSATNNNDKQKQKAKEQARAKAEKERERAKALREKAKAQADREKEKQNALKQKEKERERKEREKAKEQEARAKAQDKKQAQREKAKEKKAAEQEKAKKRREREKKQQVVAKEKAEKEVKQKTALIYRRLKQKQPKRANAFSLYVKSRMETRDKSVPIVEAMKSIASSWKTLPEADKQVFIDKAAKANENFSTDLAKFKEEYMPPKRPLTPYLRFMSDNYSNFKAQAEAELQGQGENKEDKQVYNKKLISVIGKAGSSAYKKLSSSELDAYKQRYNKEMVEYRKKFEAFEEKIAKLGDMNLE